MNGNAFFFSILTFFAFGAAACPQPNLAVNVAALENGAQFRLEDGRILIMPGVELIDSAGAMAVMREWLADGVVKIALLTDKADRWDRWPAVIAPQSAPDGVFLAEDLVLSGLALYLPDPAAKSCRDMLLTAEREARKAKRGAWLHRSVILAEDAEALRKSPLGLIIVEGTVTHVGRSGDRVALNLGSKPAEGLVALYSEKGLKLKENLGFTEDEWIGRRIRVRGLLDRRFGLSLEISGLDAVELVEEGR